MLDTSHYLVYQQLHQGLVKLKKSLNLEDLEQMKVQFEFLLHESDEDLESRERSLITELHRELRLAKTDLLFLGAAKNPTTQATRRAILQERLSKMISFTSLLYEGIQQANHSL
ncbi:heterocyst frequency control protein PatD [Gloeocapsa sp. PCC 73106]|uniref:heterocyst frequency control protein PatD n=1 Tax=Gloeocapsa sp. PCC 73106 TaxID=102232 RepID=UPI0002AC1525|nr:heterocyst frequency control protein PatD [Gloeocapsa sp. PCC 73106]ELR98000.1 hypothetical protein GLO73106DRAFT_00018190 [Gloeocapsa sp. PCC 73106]